MTPWPMFDLTDDGYAPPFDLPASATQKEIVYAWWDHVRALGFHRRLCPSRDLDSWNDAVRLAWSAQSSLEQVFAWLAERARRLVGRDLLCLSGGVALNCSSNGLLPPPVYAPPVPHDAGVALGAAWCVVPPRHTGPPLGPYLGRTVPRTEIEAALSKQDLTARDVSPAEIGERLLHGEIGAVVTGRAEIGPRALCHRSIISSAHDVTLRDRLNAMKGREPWRPLCPVGLVECEGRYWGANDSLHRYMIGASVATGRGRTELPAAVHVDGTLRPQVMSDERELMWSVLDSLRSAGAPPAVINTSFNVNGEPVVDDAHGAIESARTIGLDFLVLDDRIVDLRGRAPKNRERAAAASRSPSVHGHAVPSHTP
jgi:carbamoyltransferase